MEAIYGLCYNSILLVIAYTFRQVYRMWRIEYLIKKCDLKVSFKVNYITRYYSSSVRPSIIEFEYVAIGVRCTNTSSILEHRMAANRCYR